MSSRQKIRVAVVGLGFGAQFVPIYLHHPDVAQVTICDSDPHVLNEVGAKYRVGRRTTNLNAVLASDEVDAVHLLTPIPLHAGQAEAVLLAGKHCACTVPMATSIDDLRRVVAAQRNSGRVYMGMETAVFTRRFLYVREMLARGEIGKLQFLRGAHYQDMEQWPAYWLGLPPMHYATHAVSPLLALAGTRATGVHCLGSGTMRPELHTPYGNPYPIETAIFELASPLPLAAEVTRSLYHTAHCYTESFNVYGDKATFEWEQIEEEVPVVFRLAGNAEPESRRGNRITAERIEVPDRQDLLPAEIACFTQPHVYDENDPHLSFVQGGGHGGSHPHLVHEFVRSIVEERAPWPDAVTTANWNAPGICAHESALQGGAYIKVPGFE